MAVRYDPFDAGAAYAYVERQWVRCCSEYHTVFQGRSQKEILLEAANCVVVARPVLAERRYGQETG